MYIVFSIPSPYWKSLHFNKPSLSYKTPCKKSCTCSGITERCPHDACGVSKILPFLSTLSHLLYFIQPLQPRFAATGTWSPFSWAKLAELGCHWPWLLGCIPADTLRGWYSRVNNTVLKEVQYIYMDGCLSHERGCNHCGIVHVDFTLVKFHSLLH